jgi:hypothetical protein
LEIKKLPDHKNVIREPIIPNNNIILISVLWTHIPLRSKYTSIQAGLLAFPSSRGLPIFDDSDPKTENLELSSRNYSDGPAPDSHRIPYSPHDEAPEFKDYSVN